MEKRDKSTRVNAETAVIIAEESNKCNTSSGSTTPMINQLKRYLTDNSAAPDPQMEDLLLDASLSKEVDSELQQIWKQEDGTRLAMDPQRKSDILKKIKASSLLKSAPTSFRGVALRWSAAAAIVVVGLVAFSLFWSPKEVLEPQRVVAVQTPPAVIAPTDSMIEVVKTTPEPTRQIAIVATPPAEPVVIKLEPLVQEAVVEQSPVLLAEAKPEEVCKVPIGEVREVVLSDGSTIKVQGGSTLTYKDFGADTRTVTLDGEAYFTVAKMNGMPFMVESNGLNVCVTGTQFNVDNFANKAKGVVLVTQGSVETTTPSGVKYYLHAGSEFSYDFNNYEASVVVETGSVKVVTPQGESYYIKPDNQLKYDIESGVATEKKRTKRRKEDKTR